MASITVVTTGYWGDDSILASGSWAALAWNDTVTIQNGAICTADPAVRTPTGIDVGVKIICIAGFSEFHINNQSDTPIVFYGPEAGTLRVEAGCLFKITGKSVVIHTGDGTEGQSTDGWTTLGFNAADEPGCIEVETGNGTNVWEQWIDLADKLFSEIGVGTLGNWYQYDNSTGVITFGDGGKPNLLTSAADSGQNKLNVVAGADFTAGDYIHVIEGSVRETIVIASISSNELTTVTNLTNSYTTAGVVRIVKGGNIVPNGARIRVYNIGLGTKNSGGTRIYSATLANNFDTELNPGGKLNIDKCFLFGFYLYFFGHADISIKNCGGVVRPRFDSSPGGSVENFVLGVDRYLTPATIAVSLSVNWVFKNCIFTTYSQSVFSSDIGSTVWENCDFIVIARVSAQNRPMPYGPQSSVTFLGCRFIGGAAATTGSDISLTDCDWSDAPHGAPFGSYNDYSLYLEPGLNTVVDDFSIIADGFVNLTVAVPIRGCTVFKNSNLAFLGTQVWTPSRGVASAMINCTLQSTSVIYSGSATQINVKMQGIRTNFVPQIVTSVPTGLIVKQCDVPDVNIFANVGSASDTHFYECRLPVLTAGIMGIWFCPRSATGTGYTESDADDLRWNMNGSLYIFTAGGWLLYEWPHRILGVTAFPADGVVTIAGSGTENFTLEYQIDVGSGWTTLAALNHTNLSAHTINPLMGFRFRLKISHAAGSASDYLNRLNWSTTVDYVNYPYPLDTVNVTLQNIVDGSRYRVYNQTTSKEIASGVQSGSADIIIPEVAYNGVNEVLLIRVRKGGGGSTDYKPFETNATLTANGATVWVSQVPDDLTT